jgi:hypothetical protein
LQDFLDSRVGQVAIRNVTGDGIYPRWVQSSAQYSWVNWFVNLDLAVRGYSLRLGSSDSYVVGGEGGGDRGGTQLTGTQSQRQETLEFQSMCYKPAAHNRMLTTQAVSSLKQVVSSHPGQRGAPSP